MEIHEDKTKVRRAGNKALPEAEAARKRDQKATDKSAAAVAKATGEDEYGDDGKVILEEKDFDNP